MHRLLLRFGKAKDGLAAVEFALILPVMMLLFFGVVETSLALTCRANVTNVASNIADLVAQESTISPSDMKNVFNAANAILYPYTVSSATTTITVYSIVDNGTSAGKLSWSCTRVGTANPTVGTGTAPPLGTTGGAMIANANLKNGVPTYGGNGSVILVRITYLYASPTSMVVIGTKTMQNDFYARPRRVASIAAPTSGGATSCSA